MYTLLVWYNFESGICLSSTEMRYFTSEEVGRILIEIRFQSEFAVP